MITKPAGWFVLLIVFYLKPCSALAQPSVDPIDGKIGPATEDPSLNPDDDIPKGALHRKGRLGNWSGGGASAGVDTTAGSGANGNAGGNGNTGGTVDAGDKGTAGEKRDFDEKGKGGGIKERALAREAHVPVEEVQSLRETGLGWGEVSKALDLLGEKGQNRIHDRGDHQHHDCSHHSPHHHGGYIHGRSRSHTRSHGRGK